MHRLIVNIMTKVKVKLRPSSVKGKAGTIYYQVTHRSSTQQITTNIRLQPNEWNATSEQVIVNIAYKSITQNCIDSDTTLYKKQLKYFNHNHYL